MPENTREQLDFSGYDVLIECLESKGVLDLRGDLLEIGAFLGGGTYKLSRYLDRKKSPKTIYVVDIFDPDFDWTKDIEGVAMATYYRRLLGRFEGKSQHQVFMETVSSCRNVSVIRGDSMQVALPTDTLCFGYVDGHHDPAYVENDFHLVWDRLCPGGVLALHDYAHKLPHVTATIDRLVEACRRQVLETHHHRESHVLFVLKG